MPWLPRFPDFWLVPPAFATVVGLFGLQNADGVWVCTGSDWFFGSFLRLLLPWWVILGYKMWVRCMGRDARMAACCDWRCDVVGCSARLVCSCCWGPPLLLTSCVLGLFCLVVSKWGYDSGGFWRFWALFTPLFAHDLRFCRFCRDREQKGYGRWLVVRVLGAASDGLWNSAGDGMRLVGSIGP